jgi:hypothetical protein
MRQPHLTRCGRARHPVGWVGPPCRHVLVLVFINAEAPFELGFTSPARYKWAKVNTQLLAHFTCLAPRLVAAPFNTCHQCGKRQRPTRPSLPPTPVVKRGHSATPLVSIGIHTATRPSHAPTRPDRAERPLPNPFQDNDAAESLPFRDTRHHLLLHQQSHAMQQCASKRSIVRREASKSHLLNVASCATRWMRACT